MLSHENCKSAAHTMVGLLAPGSCNESKQHTRSRRTTYLWMGAESRVPVHPVIILNLLVPFDCRSDPLFPTDSRGPAKRMQLVAAHGIPEHKTFINRAALTQLKIAVPGT